MQLRQLKVKIKSLAAEQRIIRHEEHKAKQSDLWHSRRDNRQDNGSPFICREQGALWQHRIYHVRPEIRSAHIAYGLLRGKKLEQIESPRTDKSLLRKPYRAPDWKRIKSLLTKYGNEKQARHILSENDSQSV